MLDQCPAAPQPGLSAVREEAGRTAASVHAYGTEYGVYSGKKSEPTWITIQLSKLAGRVKNRSFNQGARQWVETEWPELLMAGQSHWPRKDRGSRARDLQAADEPLSGGGDTHKGGRSEGDGHEADKVERHAVESTKDAMRAKANEFRKQLKKCDYCRSATRAVRECVVDQGSGTCGTCRKAGKGCYFQGLSLNGTQNKKAASVVMPDEGVSSTTKKGKRKATSVIQSLDNDRPAEFTASDPEGPTPVQRATRSRAQRDPSAAKMGKTVLNTATKTREKNNGRLTHERPDTSQEGPRRKRGRYDVEKTSEKRHTRATAAALVGKADQRPSRPSERASDGPAAHVASPTASEAAGVDTISLDWGEELPEGVNGASDSEGEGAGTLRMKTLSEVIKTFEVNRAKLAKKIEEMEEDRSWLDAQLKANRARLRELQQAQIAEAGPSH
ncbi:uncharacterized protein B0H18DRAFT_1125441 [Fomitopsis serialis]|uniref:uncharacterized protein n=1 Tax=Fomitopsis serialis TaxID=139415 RepID=UPI0020082474|nr:uncharacterized protein B0H18DRAFT_1125441 [Neoantrodia serialis]KAH9914560.1 hypothetical protein B0H18DRAFT_1125441 [Neoantrodia serialis]